MNANVLSVRTKHMRQTSGSLVRKVKGERSPATLATMYKFFVILFLSNSFSFTSPTEITIQFKNQYLSGIFPDYNLCQIFSPVTGSSGTRYFQGARPVANVSENVRYIVLHKCRYTSKQDDVYQPMLNRAYECEDTNFVQVITVIESLLINH